jgi:hypothetical protein
MRRLPSPAIRPQSKPSRHYGTEFWFIDGPFDGRKSGYRGRRVRVILGLIERPKQRPTSVFGEYVHQSRPLGDKLGYEHYYQWFGPTPVQITERVAA